MLHIHIEAIDRRAIRHIQDRIARHGVLRKSCATADQTTVTLNDMQIIFRLIAHREGTRRRFQSGIDHVNTGHKVTLGDPHGSPEGSR